MQVTASRPTIAREGRKALAKAPRVVEKPSASNRLGARGEPGEDKTAKPPPPLQVELVCRDDTQSHDPFWDAPRLLPTFVAQVLGQAMPAPVTPISLAKTYGNAAPRQAVLVDRKG